MYAWIVGTFHQPNRYASTGESLTICNRATHVRLQHGANGTPRRARRKDDLMKRVKALGVLRINTHKAAHPLRGHQNVLESRCCSSAPFSEADRGEFDADVRLKSCRSLRL